MRVRRRFDYHSPAMPIHALLRSAATLIFVAALAGCAGIVSKASQRFADNLAAGILNQDDIALARDGIPSWLLLVDGLIQGDPRNTGLLVAGARLYGSYAGGFVDDPERAQRLSAHGFDYARRATCIDLPGLCKVLDQPFEPFQAEVAKAGVKHVATLYVLATTWAGRIQADTGDWAAIADIPRVQALLDRVVALVPDYMNGEPYMYLGVMATLRPAFGRPEPDGARALRQTVCAPGVRQGSARQAAQRGDRGRSARAGPDADQRHRATAGEAAAGIREGLFLNCTEYSECVF